jgi:hypothetical protein
MNMPIVMTGNDRASGGSPPRRESPAAISTDGPPDRRPKPRIDTNLKRSSSIVLDTLQPHEQEVQIGRGACTPDAGASLSDRRQPHRFGAIPQLDVTDLKVARRSRHARLR